MKLFLTFFAALLFMQVALAQETNNSVFSIDAQLRTRAEYANGYKILPTEDSKAGLFIGQRSRVNLNYSNNIMEFKFSMQDVHVWGSDDKFNATGMWGNTVSTQLYEAWGKYKINPNIAVKIGRQELNYGTARLLSARNWSNYALTYDAAVFQYSKNGLKVDLGFSVNNNAELTKATIYDQTKMKTLNFLYISKKVNDQLSLGFTELATGFEPTGSVGVVQVKNTAGLTLKYNSKTFFGVLEGYYQNGKTITSQDISASMINLSAGYKMNNLKFSVGMDYLSGQDPNETEKVQTFDQIYGARYKYFGNLNYFMTPASTKNGGLVDIFANMSYKKGKNALSLTFHSFQLAQDVTNANGDLYDKSLGQEIDINFTRKLAKGVALKIGMSTAMPSETLEQFKGLAIGDATTPQWTWVMFVFKPQFVKIEK